MPDRKGMLARTSLYRRIWRRHFYGGLFVVPMCRCSRSVARSICSSESRALKGTGAAGSSGDRGRVSPEAQVKAALAAFSCSRRELGAADVYRH